MIKQDETNFALVQAGNTHRLWHTEFVPNCPDCIQEWGSQPDLLQALSLTVARLEHHLCNIESCDMETADDLTLEQARAAIAKATKG